MVYFWEEWRSTPCGGLRDAKRKCEHMTREEILEFSGQTVDDDTLKQIQESDAVKAIRDNGIDGNHPGKHWFVVVFKEGSGISVYGSW